MEIIQQIGSYAGLAAIVGLAVLSALYFSQARDVKRLREWAGRAPERAAQPAVPAPQRVVAQPQPKPAGTTPAAKPAPGTPAAGRPAGAPKVPDGPPQIPGVPAPAVAAAAGARPATAVAGAPAATAERPGGPGAATPAGQGKQAPDDTKPPEPEAGGDAGKPPASAADVQDPPATGKEDATATPPTGPAPAGSDKAPAQPPPPAAIPSAARPATPAGQARPTPTPAPRFERPTPPARPAPQQTVVIPPGAGSAPPPGRLTRSRIAVLAVAGVLVLGGGAAFAVSQLTGDDSEPTTRNAQDPGGDADPDEGGQSNGGRAVNPADVTVAVLNGTLVPGLAAAIGDEVEQLGFDLGTLGNADNQEQQRAESVVLYADGHRREAVVVSRRLKIPQREAIDAETQALAGDAGVVVVAGGDQTP